MARSDAVGRGCAARRLALMIGFLLVGTAAEAQPSFKFGARLQIDHDRFDGVYSERGDTRTATYLRRADVELSGALHKDWRYALEVEADSEGSVTLDTASVAYSGFAAGVLVAGRFDPDFGLEPTISSNWTTGIERSAIWDLAPDAGEGSDSVALQFRTSGARHHLSAGAFHKSDFDLFVLRGVLAPLVQEMRVLHIGLSYADAPNATSDGRIRSRLAVRGVTEDEGGQRITLAPSSPQGPFDGDRAWVAEFALMRGPWSLQSEWLQRRLEGATAAGERQATGHYVQLAWTVTGESRRYRIDDGRFSGIDPAGRKRGAWEVFGRRDRISVRSGVGSVRATVRVLGLNWYANEWVKVSLNVLRARTDGRSNDVGDTSGDAVSLRAQVKF